MVSSTNHWLVKPFYDRTIINMLNCVIVCIFCVTFPILVPVSGFCWWTQSFCNHLSQQPFQNVHFWKRHFSFLINDILTAELSNASPKGSGSPRGTLFKSNHGCSIKPEVWDLLQKTFFCRLSATKASVKLHLFHSNHSVLCPYATSECRCAGRLGCWWIVQIKQPSPHQSLVKHHWRESVTFTHQYIFDSLETQQQLPSIVPYV